MKFKLGITIAFASALLTAQDAPAPEAQQETSIPVQTSPEATARLAPVIAKAALMPAAPIEDVCELLHDFCEESPEYSDSAFRSVLEARASWSADEVTELLKSIMVAVPDVHKELRRLATLEKQEKEAIAKLGEKAVDLGGTLDEKRGTLGDSIGWDGVRSDNFLADVDFSDVEDPTTLSLMETLDDVFNVDPNDADKAVDNILNSFDEEKKPIAPPNVDMGGRPEVSGSPDPVSAL